MEKEEWLKRYKARMVERGLTEKDAENLLDAIKDDPDLVDNDPEGAAD
jgi:hypothetical protein